MLHLIMTLSGSTTYNYIFGDNIKVLFNWNLN